MKNAVLLVVGLVLVLSGSGCATIVSGRHQDIHVTSDPPGVRVKADTGVEVTTPAELSLTRNKRHTLVAECEGSEPQQKELQCGMNGWIVGNILIGGVIGVVVDIVSGAHGQLSPDAVHFDFTEAGRLSENRKSEYVASHPDLKKSIRVAIQTERPHPGMRKDELIAAFGEPDQVVQEGKYEKCVYLNRDPQCWYIKNGAVYRTLRRVDN